MVIQDVHFTLKDGRHAIIRNPKYEDIPGVLDYLNISARETEFILRYPEECDKYNEDDEKKIFDRVNSSNNEVMLICVVDGKVAGNCHISWSDRIKTKHRAGIGIALISEFWNQGIGTKMFEIMIDIAEGNPQISQIELEFLEGNKRGRALYEKMGFRIVGVHPNAIKLKDGTLLNSYLMIRECNHC